MKYHKLRLTLLIPFALAFLACQKEVISERGNSLGSQFSQLNKMGWQVADNGKPAQAGRPGTLDDPNVRVIKPADFSQVQFRTNFQVDDPKLRAQMEQQNHQPGQEPPPPTYTPFGPAPIQPR